MRIKAYVSIGEKPNSIVLYFNEIKGDVIKLMFLHSLCHSKWTIPSQCQLAIYYQ